MSTENEGDLPASGQDGGTRPAEGEPGVSEQPRDTDMMPEAAPSTPPVPSTPPTAAPEYQQTAQQPAVAPDYQQTAQQPAVQPSAFSAPPPPQGPYDPYAPYANGQAPAPVPVAPPKRRGAAGLVTAVIVAALVAGGVGGGVGYWAANRTDNGSTTISAAASPKNLDRSPTSVAGIANSALPSVVTINASGSQESGTGTGFVYDRQGHILTNNHVVAPAAGGGKLTVTFSNGKTYNAEVVGRAQGYDVAVVKLKNAGNLHLTPLPLGDSTKVAVGDATIAIGAPFGLSGTVTTGIVSAKDRPVASSDGQGSASSYMSALQTDASINPGNSGGPLLNAGGAVIGINSAIQSANNGGSSPFGGGSTTQSGSIGLGFAIPINEAKYVADTLIRTGTPVYAVMGLSVDMNYEGVGAKVSQTGANGGAAVTAGGPGAKAGLKPGDVITKFGDTVIDSGPTLIGAIWQHRPGDHVQLTYTRAGKTATTTVTLGERKGDSSS
ncbi:trypsin-like peptidase domain-containing protein [Streptomyces sp. SL13]|uniref:Trypsin-like peptidase domain-containing protein n=1 Tax=Streptantibioticus silvisoli TaxID=2705255 RepID=A0AA90H019_9ACTN|nr:trypsin-like peptidase domain-containing protein [Streptantibioticus silvisoli]MDI5967161.1 trypsin-like peptidase domain-containing protein [Streptantibioticus silvisoli]MDI5971463.1 trypsin-like peptidase domain-containing protein [Streptantibioticus silvisoli]